MFKNQKILITGVGKGIGREIFLKALKEGAFVIGVTRSKKDFKETFHFRGQHKFFYGDISRQTTIKKIFDYLKKNKIKLTGLVNNAGIRQRKKIRKNYKKRLKKNYGK